MIKTIQLFKSQVPYTNHHSLKFLKANMKLYCFFLCTVPPCSSRQGNEIISSVLERKQSSFCGGKVCRNFDKSSLHRLLFLTASSKSTLSIISLSLKEE